MKVGGQIPWNVALICETSKICCLMGRRPTKDAWENLSKDQLFHLVHWLRITLSLRRISPESINLERKFYLDFSSDTLLHGRGEFERVMYWSQTLRSWRRWTHRKSTQKRLNAKEVIFPKKENLFFQSQMDESNTWKRSRPENIHLDTAASKSRRKSRWLSWRIRRIFSTTSWLTSGCRWSDERFLVHVGKLHIPPSRWILSQTLLAERRIIPYSTEIHWCNQNYSHEFGCQAGEVHWWLLEHWWLSRLVWSLDGFHAIYSTRWKSSWRIFVVRGEIDEKTAYIQARSSMARAMEVNGKACEAEGKTKVGWRKDSSWQRTKIAGNLFHRPWGWGVQGNHQERA